MLPAPKKPHFKQISSEEIVARREKGLCYNCDDKWGPTHKCKDRFFLLIAEEDTGDSSTIDTPIPDLDTTSLPGSPIVHSEAQISFSALSSHPAPKALRIMGHISKQPVTILVDRGSTHYFVQDRVAKFLGLST